MKSWINATLIRTIKTMAETAIALIGTNAVSVTSVDWVGIVSAAAVSGIVCILTCIKGLPECEPYDWDEVTEDEDGDLDE